MPSQPLSTLYNADIMPFRLLQLLPAEQNSQSTLQIESDLILSAVLTGLSAQLATAVTVITKRSQIWFPVINGASIRGCQVLGWSTKIVFAQLVMSGPWGWVARGRTPGYVWSRLWHPPSRRSWPRLWEVALRSWLRLWRDIKNGEVKNPTARDMSEWFTALAASIDCLRTTKWDLWLKDLREVPREACKRRMKAKRDGAPSRLVTSVESRWSPSWGPLIWHLQLLSTELSAQPTLQIQSDLIICAALTGLLSQSPTAITVTFQPTRECVNWSNFWRPITL